MPAYKPTEIHICLHTNTHKFTYACVLTHKNTHIPAYELHCYLWATCFARVQLSVTSSMCHTYRHTRIHTCRHTCIHTYRHTRIHTCRHTCIHTYRHTRIHTCRHTCINTYRHTRIHTYRHLHIHTYTHIYTSVCLYADLDATGLNWVNSNNKWKNQGACDVVEAIHVNGMCVCVCK